MQLGGVHYRRPFGTLFFCALHPQAKARGYSPKSLRDKVVTQFLVIQSFVICHLSLQVASKPGGRGSRRAETPKNNGSAGASPSQIAVLKLLAIACVVSVRD